MALEFFSLTLFGNKTSLVLLQLILGTGLWNRSRATVSS